MAGQAVFAAGFGLAAVTGGVAQILAVRHPMSFRRIIIFSFCALPILLFLFGCVVVGDYGEPQDPPVPVLWQAFLCFCVFTLWPLVVATTLLHHDPAGVYWYSLWVVTCLFWGFVIEMFRKIWKRRMPNTY
jgi:putative Ca2+/H+ antiporter (TMEM165/GDT1 family)